jgi:hypothetical protein
MENVGFIIVNPITVDSIIFVGINFRKLKKNGKLWILTFVVCGILPDIRKLISSKLKKKMHCPCTTFILRNSKLTKHYRKNANVK